MSINFLPDELTVHILKNLSVRRLIAISDTSSAISRCCTDILIRRLPVRPSYDFKEMQAIFRKLPSNTRPFTRLSQFVFLTSRLKRQIARIIHRFSFVELMQELPISSDRLIERMIKKTEKIPESCLDAALSHRYSINTDLIFASPKFTPQPIWSYRHHKKFDDILYGFTVRDRRCLGINSMMQLAMDLMSGCHNLDEDGVVYIVKKYVQDARLKSYDENTGIEIILRSVEIEKKFPELSAKILNESRLFTSVGRGSISQFINISQYLRKR